MPKKLPKRRKTASKKPGQTTLSQFENIAPVIKRLETLEGQNEESDTINKKQRKRPGKSSLLSYIILY